MPFGVWDRCESEAGQGGVLEMRADVREIYQGHGLQAIGESVAAKAGRRLCSVYVEGIAFNAVAV